MKQHICFNAFVCTTFTLLSTASAQEAAKQPTKPAANTAITADAAEQAGKMREILSYPAEKLHELARERAFKALAALGPGQKLARWSAREQNIQNTRLECLGNVEKANKEREELRTELDGQLEEIRRQFAEDETECQRQLLVVIDTYKPRLKELKAESDQWTAKMNETDKQLATIRRNVAGLDRDVRLTERGLPFRSRTPPETADSNTSLVQTLKELGIDFDPKRPDLTLNSVPEQKTAPDASASSETPVPETRNVQKALAELEVLFD